MQKITIALFNNINNAKWDDKIDLSIGFFSKDTCTLGFKKLSKRKKHTKKIKELLRNDNTLDLKDKKITIYIDIRLLDRLVFFKDFPFIIREKYIKPLVFKLFCNKGPSPFKTYQISTDKDFSNIIYDESNLESMSNEKLKKITDNSKGYSYGL